MGGRGFGGWVVELQLRRLFERDTKTVYDIYIYILFIFIFRYIYIYDIERDRHLAAFWNINITMFAFCVWILNMDVALITVNS